jgi:SAM-dependent methyltransferase
MSKISKCRSCSESHLVDVLDLGNMPLANSLITRDNLEKSEERFPLKLVICMGCTLLQITETVSPEKLFKNYVYFSSFSDTMLAHAKSLAEELISRKGLNAKSLVVEIASNDGYLLKNFVAAGIPVLGVEPAENVAKVAQKAGVTTIPDFFSSKLAESLVKEDRKADVMFANNVMAHVPEINDIVAGIAKLLKYDGLFVMETPYFKPFLEKLEFDTIYHEHLFYYSATALSHLFNRHGLEIVDLQFHSIHGGSARVFVGHTGKNPIAPIVPQVLKDEKEWGIFSIEKYNYFAAKVTELRSELKNYLAKIKGEGKSIAAYGAAAKGSTLLNSIGVGTDTIDFVVDRSPHKQGMFTSGGKIPILSPDALLEKRPDYLLILAWNFSSEIIKQTNAYEKAGGKYIIPVPSARLATGADAHS